MFTPGMPSLDRGWLGAIAYGTSCRPPRGFDPVHTWPGAERVTRLESDRKRRSLAEALRSHVELDRTPRGPAAARCATAPVLRGLSDHSDVVERIASEFERGACDPRAIIRVERLLTMPPAIPPGDDERAELGRTLRGIARMPGRPHEQPEGAGPVEVRHAAMVVATT